MRDSVERIRNNIGSDPIASLFSSNDEHAMMNGMLAGSFFVNITTATVINPFMEEEGGREVWEEEVSVEEEMEEEQVKMEEVKEVEEEVVEEEEVNEEEVEEEEEEVNEEEAEEAEVEKEEAEEVEEEVKEEEVVEWENQQVIKLNDGFGNDPGITEWGRSAYQSITQILIGNDCLQFLTRLELKQYPCLEILTIGKNCCTKEKGELLIVECPSLRSIIIGSKSCPSWVTLRLENCNNLQSIETGEDCFHDCGSLVLSGKDLVWL